MVFGSRPGATRVGIEEFCGLLNESMKKARGICPDGDDAACESVLVMTST